MKNEILIKKEEGIQFNGELIYNVYDKQGKRIDLLTEEQIAYSYKGYVITDLEEEERYFGEIMDIMNAEDDFPRQKNPPIKGLGAILKENLRKRQLE